VYISVSVGRITLVSRELANKGGNKMIQSINLPVGQAKLYRSQYDLEDFVCVVILDYGTGEDITNTVSSDILDTISATVEQLYPDWVKLPYLN